MKKILKFLLLFIVSACAGFAIAMVCVVLFTDISFGTFFQKMGNVGIGAALTSSVLAAVCFVAALFVHILLHEGGHLLFGLASGYGFVSFRVGNITFIKDGEKIRIKRFAIAGTGGQCLMSPPDVPHQELPYFWYNAGGVLMNLLTAIIALVLFIRLDDMPQALFQLLLMFFICGVLLALLNGIPLKIGGITNDAYNIVLMHKDADSRKYLMHHLLINAAIGKGIRPRDMPAEWFPRDEITDYSNIFQISSMSAYASLLIDRGEFEEAERIYRDMLLHRKEIVELLVKEICCELLFLELVGACRPEELERLYTKELKQYINQYKNTMTSKQRILCAMALHQDNNPEEAERICQEVEQKQASYLQQGEVASDLHIMKKMIADASADNKRD